MDFCSIWVEGGVPRDELVAVLARWTSNRSLPFSPTSKCCFIQTNKARLGLVALDLNNHYV